MEIKCDCGNVTRLNEINDDTNERNHYTEGEGLYVTVSGFRFWQQHDVVGLICDKCDKDLWMFT